MGNEKIGPPPFVEAANGCTTEASVRAALDMCNIGEFADLDASYRGLRGKLAPLIANNCQPKHLRQEWPEQFKKIASMAVLSA